ncbi:MAG: lytic transglycosylase domain-containing protein, partial [Pseudomonadota bacterium]
PSTNIEIGQTHLERLRDAGATQGLLPKVIASYNAGLTPVGAWNGESRDGGDPLLYIESIPYWETRGYVAIVLRNYWMYERQGGKPSASRVALAQGLWPKFPGMAGAPAVRLQTAVAPPRFRPLPLPIDPYAAPPSVAAASSTAILGSR